VFAKLTMLRRRSEPFQDRWLQEDIVSMGLIDKQRGDCNHRADLFGARIILHHRSAGTNLIG
jgi:hypothetical protein